MRVLHLLPPASDPRLVAPYSFLQEEIEALCNAGVEITVISTAVEREEVRGKVHMVPLPDGGTVAERSRTLGFMAKHAAALPPGILKEFRRCFHNVRIEQFAADLVQQRNLDLIHSHFGYPSGLGGLLARRETGVPLISTFRGMDVLFDASIDYGLRLEPFYDRALRSLLREADCCTFWSEYTRSIGLELGASEQNTTVIRKGVDLQRFSPVPERIELRKEIGIDSPLILVVAGLIKRKGVDTVLRALALLQDTHEFTLVIGGEGPEGPELVTLADELGLADRVRFMGRIGRKEISAYFAACDLFVLGSRVEASGNVLFEAMASGRPVICTDSGGPPEYVVHGETGFVVPVAEPAEMADRIKLLLDRPEYADRLGGEGRRVAERKLEYNRMTESFLRLYGELTAAANRSQAA